MVESGKEPSFNVNSSCVTGLGEEALRLAGDSADAIDLAISGAQTVALERKKLRAEEDVYRSQWDHQNLMHRIYKDAAALEARKGTLFIKVSVSVLLEGLLFEPVKFEPQTSWFLCTLDLHAVEHL